MARTLNEQQLVQARASASSLDLLTRSPYNVSPSAPIIIPILMIVVTLFTLVCLALKLFMNYLSSRSSNTDIYTLSDENSFNTDDPKVGSDVGSSQKGRPIRLDQLTPQRTTQLKSVVHKNKLNKHTLKAMARVARHHASDRSPSSNDDNDADRNSINNDDGGNDSPTNLSRDDSDETSDIRATQSDFVYAPPAVQPYSAESSNYPELHTVRMTSVDDYTTMRPTTESDI